MSPRPTISVVVPSFRSEATIRACLRSLLAQDTEAPYEVIVVDSARDGAAEIVRREFPDVLLVHLPERTEAPAARNLGVERAQADLVAFLDSDCVAPPDWIRRLRQALADGYDGVGGAIANGNGDGLVSWAGYLCEFREFLPGGRPRDADNLTLGNAAYRRSALRTAGGFPVGCFPQEDQVLHRRLRQHGVRLRLDPGVVVAHTHRAVLPEFLEHQRRIGRANARVLGLLGGRGSVLARRRALAVLAMPALVPFRFLRTVVACLGVERGLLLRRPRLFWLCWRGMWSWGRGFLEGTRRERGGVSHERQPGRLPELSTRTNPVARP